MKKHRERIISEIKKDPQRLWSILLGFDDLWCRNYRDHKDEYEKCIEEYEELRNDVYKKLIEILDLK